MAVILQTSPSRDHRVESRDPTRSVPPEIHDVWSRSGTKYRIRAVVLLAVNVLLFAGLGSFAFWLRSGRWFAVLTEGYWSDLARTFDFRGNSVTLGSLLLEPISVYDVPMQIPILGLLMAALISIPILVAILYRFWSSVPFIAIIGLIACMPWLAITLTGSCIIASVRPFRVSYRFVSALLGLVPAVIYLILASSGTAEVITGTSDPVEHIKFIAPWVLAIVAASAVFAVVLILAKLVDYRPGAIAPLLATMFVLPAALFEVHVGRDELYYRLLETLSTEYFGDVDSSVGLEEAKNRAWRDHPLPRPSRAVVDELVEARWLFQLMSDPVETTQPTRSALALHQQTIRDRCDRFLSNFPDSVYAPCVLYIKARASDMRVDPGEFIRTKWIRFYDDFPSPASIEPWNLLATGFPHSKVAAVALLRLAQWDAQGCRVARAVARLDTLISRFEQRDGGPSVASNTNRQGIGVLSRSHPEASLAVPLDHIVFDARVLRELLLSNRDPVFVYDPICGSTLDDAYPAFGMLDLDPRDRRYAENLRAIKQRYHNARLVDNIDLEIAKASATVATGNAAELVERLEQCVRDHPNGDALPEALFRLGVAYKMVSRSVESDAEFARLMRDFPDSPWSWQAHRQSWRPASVRQASALP